MKAFYGDQETKNFEQFMDLAKKLEKDLVKSDSVTQVFKNLAKEASKVSFTELRKCNLTEGEMKWIAEQVIQDAKGEFDYQDLIRNVFE